MPNTTIASAAVNSDLSDIANALTNSVSADGQTVMTGSLQAFGGSAAAPGITFAGAINEGFYPISGGIGASVGGNQVAALTAGGWSNTGATANVPIGTVVDFAGSSAPAGWLVCDGSSVSQTTYAALFTVVGTTYGGGGGNFNLPDARARVIAGMDTGNATGRMLGGQTGNVAGGAATLGSSGGQESHALTVPELATFTPSGSVGGTGTISSFQSIQTGESGASASSGTTNLTTATGGSLGALSTSSGNVNLNAATFAGNSVGSNAVHNTTQPTLILNKIIFAGV